jgi:hypothetical protein
MDCIYRRKNHIQRSEGRTRAITSRLLGLLAEVESVFPTEIWATVSDTSRSQTVCLRRTEGFARFGRCRAFASRL